MNLALQKPMEAFLEEAVWFKQRKTRTKVALFLTPVDAARAASQQSGKIDMWENPSFDGSGSKQLVGTLQCALSLSSALHFDSRLDSLVSSACISSRNATENEVHPSGTFCSITEVTPPPPSLSFSLSKGPDSRKRIIFGHTTTDQNIHGQARAR